MDERITFLHIIEFNVNISLLNRTEYDSFG